jgi:hypothetical protein
MSLLKNIETIQQYSKPDLEKLNKSELINLVLTSQFTINTLRTSSNWQNKESRHLKEELKRKRRALKTFDSFFETFDLNPRHLPSSSLTDFDNQNFTVKNFIEMQQKKISFQEQKIKELQIKQIRKNFTTKNLQQAEIFEEKLKKLENSLKNLKKPQVSLVFPGKFFEISQIFKLSDEKIREHRRVIENEFEKNFESLRKNYTDKIFLHLINKRKTWDKKYRFFFAEIQESLQNSFESHTNKIKLIQRLKQASGEFVEGKLVSVTSFSLERIRKGRKKVKKFEFLERETQQDPDYHEVEVRW